MLINESIHIQQKPDSNWDFWLDVSNDVQWRDGIVKAEWSSPPPYGVGSTGIHTHEKIGAMHWRVTKLVEGSSFEFMHTAGELKHSIATFSVAPTKNGSLVTVQMNVSGPILMRIMMIFMSRLMRRGVQSDLETLKSIMEKRSENA